MLTGVFSTHQRRQPFLRLLPALALLLVIIIVLNTNLRESVVIAFNRSLTQEDARAITSKVSQEVVPETYVVPEPNMCDIDCKDGEPCEYKDEVDFRIIVITYDRPESLSKCLDHILQVDTLGDQVSVEIWVDRPKKGDVNEKVVNASVSFLKAWYASGKGKGCVHIRSANAGITGQWTDTWRPKENTKEIGLILEDDIDISPMAYRWLKAAHQHYDFRADVAGYTLQMHNTNFFGLPKPKPMKGPKEDVVFMYGVLGTWGFSPHPVSWRAYQKWSHKAHEEGIKPYVPGILTTQWFKSFERSGQALGMWEQYHTYFCHINQLYTVYCNLKEKTGKGDVLLGWNRKERGLHFGGKGAGSNDALLMKQWHVDYVKFPNGTAQMDHSGSITRRV